MNRYVLVIAHDFPPAGGPGVQRVLKFVKYLPEFGWQPIVLTAKPGAYTIRDATLLQDVPPSTPIYRASDPDVNRLRPAFDRFKVGKMLSAINVALMVPDANLFWAQKARATARQIIKHYRPVVMLSSSPPASTHLLARWIRRQFGIPWVADFRDPWSENPQTPYFPGYRAHNRRMEKDVLVHCDHITTVSPPLVNALQRLSERPAKSVSLIENGYDEDDVTCLPPPHTRRFTIAYAGTFSRLRRPDAFLTAVRQLLATQQIRREEIRIVMAGKNIGDYIPKESTIENLGYLSHTALDDLRRESDLLLLVLEDDPANRGTYSGKVFEHLGCNRPTLCITHPDNVAAKLITRARGGVVVNPRPDEIAEVILCHYHDWRNGIFAYDPDWNCIRQFTRRKLTQRLAQTFDSITP